VNSEFWGQGANLGPHTARQLAVIDIGSNSVRLVVFDGRSRCPLPVFNEKVLPALGRDLAVTGRLNPEGRAAALSNIVRFVALAEAMEAQSIALLATAAVRDAVDGQDFAQEIERRTGHAVVVVDGTEEARLSALGVIAGIPEADGLAGDLGGGSLELVHLHKGRIMEQATLPIGPLRLMESGQNAFDAAAQTIDAAFAGLPWLSAIAGRSFYPVGGTWRSLARLHIKQTGYPLRIIHEYTMQRQQADSFLGLVSRLGARSLLGISGVSRQRTDALPYGALIMERLLRRAQPEWIVFSAYGLREGYLYSQLSAAEQAEDPLLTGCASLAASDSRFNGIQKALYDWTAPLFPDDSPWRQRLRAAAALLSDIAWRDHPDYRAEQSFSRILHAAFPALSHTGRVVLALAAAARHGRDQKADFFAPFASLVSEQDIEFATRLGAALRLGYALSGGALDILARTRLARDEEGIKLLIARGAEEILGAAVERRLDALGRAFAVSARIVRDGA